MLLGVRHHGPGSARAVRAALEAARPRTVLIEGPPEADALIPLAADEDMRPPVALLAHAVDEPGRSSFWPMAEFSPEWVALRWALEHGVPARFIDLPATHTLAWEKHREREETGKAGKPGETGRAGETEGTEETEGTREGAGAEENCSGGRPGATGEGPGRGRREGGEEGSGAGGGPDVGREPGRARASGGGPEDADGSGGGEGGGSGAADEDRDGLRRDPLGTLAEVAGYDDPERWWEDVVEHRATGTKDPFAPFAALEEAMGALREAYDRDAAGHEDGRDLVREAYMRIQLRSAQREFGADGVAVVCGAWHVPALRRKVALAADRALLKGLPKVRTDLTWVPWTHRRLARAGGYGAGIDAPGWYAHLFASPDRPVERWLTRVAVLLREEDRIVSSAHVIEAVRLAETLAALRGRPLPGLSETTDAVRAVLCEGSDVPLALVRDRLVVGDVLGEVPAGAPAVPLQRDLDRLQRRLRLKPEAAERELALDLRRENDAERSRLLHRLRLLGVEWGEPAASRGGTGTFRETWRLRWEPELAVRVAEAGVWGTTVLAAATAKAEADAVAAGGLARVTALAERCLLAALPDALPTVMSVLADRAALDTDVGHLAQALPALARSLRYGDVRGTDTGALAEVAAGLAERIFVGLPPACVSLDADAAERMRRHVDAVHGAVGMLDEHAGLPPRWRAVLRVLSRRDSVPGVVRGRAVRLLLDEGELNPGAAARLMGLALSPGTPPGDAAAWIEGFVGGGSGGGLLLVHDERLLALVDGWLTTVPAEAFTDVLPLLRRTFSAYEPGVRRTLGDRVRRGPGKRGSEPGAHTGTPGFATGLDERRADAVLPVVRLLLGTNPDAADVGRGDERTGGDGRGDDTAGHVGTGDDGMSDDTAGGGAGTDGGTGDGALAGVGA
ncbi:DUF5682 family protein [Streptomyces humidus]|uniref:DUF5682 family protein n=1 Tax=Streptomyces humidus TaxID=52259 RepID=UPI001E485B0D|nr:DUF5682 family protein [Streptomyces humidus]